MGTSAASHQSGFWGNVLHNKPFLSIRHMTAVMEDKVVWSDEIVLELFGQSVRYYICKETRQFHSCNKV